MSTHINAANKGDIAESVLLPGDPLRAKYIAEKFLEEPVCYNKIRNTYGYTGKYKGCHALFTFIFLKNRHHYTPFTCVYLF